MRGNLRHRNGAWRLQVLDASDGRRRWVTRTVRAPDNRAGRKIAEAALARLVVDLEAGRGATDPMTVAGLLERWVEHRSPRWAPSTRRGIEVPVGHLRRLLGRHRIDRLTPLAIDRAYAQLSAEGQSAQSVRRVHAALRTALRDAVRWRLIATNPAVDAQPPPLARRTIRAASDPTVTALLDSISDPGFRTAVLVLAATGCRRGELVALRWTDLDLEAGTIAIARAMSAGVEQRTKSGTSRVVTLDARTAALLAEWRRLRVEVALACGVGLAHDAFVFGPDPAGARPWAADSITQRWVRHRDRVARAHPEAAAVRLHDLRHYHATVLSAAGLGLADIGYRLGHASHATTALYAHPDPVVARRAATIIGEKLHGAG